MHKTLIKALVLLAVAGMGFPAHAQFSSGSDGSFGPIDVTSGTETLPLPPDGIINATTVNVANGATLKFQKNALNTPVFLLATGDIVVDGTISVVGGSGTSVAGGEGGPGGFDGGFPGFFGDEAGAGFGPGAGLGGNNGVQVDAAGNAAYGGAPNTAFPNDGNVYGSPLLVPLVGGSGGGGSAITVASGGGGGGAILLASSTAVRLFGTITARGGFRSSNPCNVCGNGSGGAIRIVAPEISGSGVANVNGAGPSNSPSGGHGRVRFDTFDPSQFTGIINPTAAGSVGAFMVTFPPGLPRLDIIEAAGEVIPEGSSAPVIVILPFGAPSSQQIVVQGRDFTGIVPIRVVLTPTSGDPIIFDSQIDMSFGNPATAVVDVDIPQNVAVQVNAWTRDQ